MVVIPSRSLALVLGLSLAVLPVAMRGLAGCGGRILVERASDDGGLDRSLDGARDREDDAPGQGEPDAGEKAPCRPTGESCSTGADCCTGTCSLSSICVCSLYGQLCASSVSCCYGVPCTYAGSPCAPDQAGCRCEY